MGIKTRVKFIKLRWRAWLLWKANLLHHRYFEELLVFLGFVHSPSFEIVWATFVFSNNLNTALEKGARAMNEFLCQAKAVIEALENNNKKEDKCDDHE